VPPKFNSVYPLTEPVSMGYLVVPNEGPIVAACIRPYLRRSPFLYSVSNMGKTKYFTT